MTQSTEQERASLSAFIEMAEREGFDTAHQWYDAKGWVFFSPSTADCWRYWQAARRAPAAQEKERLVERAMRALSYANGMLEGWNRCVADDESGFERHRSHLSSEALKELKSLAAAPQPPEAAPDCLTCNDHGAVGNILNAEPCPDCTMKRVTGCSVSNGETKAAPVQMPEPVAAESRFTTFAGNRWRWCTVEHARAFGADKGYEVRYLYTEQQVRQLLAAHGIKVAP